MDEVDEAELALVQKAVELGCRFQGYCEWAESAARRIREKPPCEGLTPEGIKALLGNFIANGGSLIQVPEKRQEKRDQGFHYYYKAIVPVSELQRGLFVELVLIDDDQDDPAVLIVSAREQST